VLPVVLLTALGLLSLRQDQLLAEQEARERAGRFAQEAANRALTLLFSFVPAPESPEPGRARLLPSRSADDDDSAQQELRPTGQGADLFRPVLEVSTQVELVWPPPIQVVPGPSPLDPSRLDSPAREAWEAAKAVQLEGDATARAAAWTNFLAVNPPVEFAANARFELAQAEAALGASNEAAARFQQLAADYPDARGESGLPLAPLARWRAAEIGLSTATDAGEQQQRFLAACSNLVIGPTLLTPMLLEHAAKAVGLEASTDPGLAEASALTTFAGARSLHAWRQLWDTTELSRALFAAARQEWDRRGLIATNDSGATELLTHRSGLAPFWVSWPDGPGGDWLLIRSPPSGLRFEARNAHEVSNLLQQVRAALPALPSYFDVSFTVAGRVLAGSRGGPVLAEREAEGAAQPGTPEPTLKAAVHLADPAALYARQRQRTWWFTALVLAAAATAGVGLASAHRAFQRQLRLNEMKSNFVSSVSHELRAPIASVRLLAESLDRGTVTDEAKRREYYQLMGRECRRLSALIENVLDFSRMDQGRKQYEFEPTDLSALVSQTVRLMQPYAAERQVALELLLPSAFGLQPSLDGRAIQQALVNLIDNAVKHSPPGAAVEIRLGEFAGSADCESPIANCQSPRAGTRSGRPSAIGDRRSAIGDRLLAPGDRPSAIHLSVTDHGPGIPADEHARIFEPFYRRGSELRRETPGIGIGLSIVKHVVEAHGGRVRVESEVGHGSRFVVELPAGAAAVQASNVEPT